MTDFINTIDVLGDDAVMDGIINRSITEFKDDVITNVGACAFRECKALTELNLPNAVSVGSEAFYDCSALKKVNVPNAEQINNSAFRGCPSLTSADLPCVISLGAEAFRNCTNLKEINVPNATTIGNWAIAGTAVASICLPSMKTITNQLFREAYNLNQVDAPVLETLSGYSFWYMGNVNTLILRNTSKVCDLTDTAEGMANCIFFIPSVLYDGYISATNWSTYANQFRKIEDYTGGTVDGTIFSANNILVGVTSSNVDTFAKQPYVAELSSEREFIVTITMGGKDITSTAYDGNGNIYIAEVTGDIVVSARVSIADIGALYSLPEPKTFNGLSDYIDTGIQLFDTAKDFTIICEAEFSKLTDNTKCLFHCMNEASPWPGLSIDGSSGVRICYTGSSSITTSISNRNDVSALAIRYVDGKMNAIRYRNASGNIVAHAVSGTPTYTKVTQNLLLGAYQEVSGTKGRFFNGTISRFDVYPNALSDEQIEALL